MTTVPRLRMFAGPNGSGKSRIKSMVRPELLGWYINPDEIEAQIRQSGQFNFDIFGISTNEAEILPFFTQSSFLEKAGLIDQAHNLGFSHQNLIFEKTEINSYFASVLADFLRKKLIDTQASFTFETVMSFPDKIDLLRFAQGAGYRTYLYYVATKDPQINIDRVKDRVALGGHPVPRDKIIERYYRSLDYLSDAIRVSNRVYLFDNSGAEPIWFAELEEVKNISLKPHPTPQWFQTYVLDKFNFTD